MSPWVSLRFLQTQTDARLVALAGAGHERAFEALVVRYRSPLLAYGRRLLGAETQAEDVLQHALLQAWIALRNGIEVHQPKAWLYRIVHNVAISSLRRPGDDHGTLEDLVDEVSSSESDVDVYMAMRHALACVAALPDTQRQVMLRTAVAGDSHEEVALALGLSDRAVRGIVYRARTSLRAAATAITPQPFIEWLSSTSPHTSRLSELSVGAGTAGIAGLLKSGAVALSTGALLGGVLAPQGLDLIADRAGHRHGLTAERKERSALTSRSALSGQRLTPAAVSQPLPRPAHALTSSELGGVATSVALHRSLGDPAPRLLSGRSVPPAGGVRNGGAGGGSGAPSRGDASAGGASDGGGPSGGSGASGSSGTSGDGGSPGDGAAQTQPVFPSPPQVTDGGSGGDSGPSGSSGSEGQTGPVRMSGTGGTTGPAVPSDSGGDPGSGGDFLSGGDSGSGLDSGSSGNSGSGDASGSGGNSGAGGTSGSAGGSGSGGDSGSSATPGWSGSE